MLPQTHFMFPFLIGLVLTKLNYLSWKLALLSGLIAVFIDVDHFIEHIIHKKKNKYSLKDTWNKAVHEHWQVERSFIHHWLGFLLVSFLLLVVLFFSLSYFLVICLAYYSHLILDHLSDWVKMKEFKIKKFGFFIEIPYYEIWFDLVLVVGIVVLVIWT